MMQQNSPTAIVMQYMRNGADIKTALAQAAQQYPETFPQQKVSLAMAVLSRPNRPQIVSNMAKERGVDLQAYTAQLQAEAQKLL